MAWVADHWVLSLGLGAVMWGLELIRRELVEIRLVLERAHPKDDAAR